MNRKERRAALKQGRAVAPSPGSLGDPPELALLLEEAVQHHQSGRLDGAEALYRRVLAVNPNHAQTLHLLGLAAHQGGRHDAAAELIGRAIAINGAIPDFHNNLGSVFQLLGRYDKAIRAYRRAVALQPDLAEAHWNLGKSHYLSGDRDAAIAQYRRTLALKPGDPDLLNNLAATLYERGDYEEAVRHYREALALRPDNAELCCNLAMALYAQTQIDEAIEQYRRALALQPDFAQAHNNLGNALLARGEHDEALTHYRRALAINPDSAESYCNIAFALNEQGNPSEAIGYCREALARRPDFAEAHNNLANAFYACGQEDEAIAHYRQAIACKPQLPEPYYSLANALNGRGLVAEAIASMERFIALRPNFIDAHVQLVYLKTQACNWRDYAAEEAALLSLVQQGVAAVEPFMLLSRASATPVDQLLCARQYSQKLSSTNPAFRHLARSAEPRIRLGYLSQDFREHPVAHLLAELIERHDRSAFEVAAYSYGPDDGSDIRRRLVAAFDRFVDITGIGDAAAAERIHANGIDILIDLNAYSGRPRTRIGALRPAPVQVNFLGYPGTMGVDFIDYIIVDPVIAPADQQPHFTEKLVQLPYCYQPSDTTREIAPPPASRAAAGLPEGGFVFCCFNNSYKLNPAVFDLWMRLLCEAPDSVLWLLETNSLVAGNLRREAAARGVAPERLVFAPRLPQTEHLGRHRLADLFLDTFPYNAHTTASDALWAGLPLLTVAGATFAGRVAASLLHALGRSELIAASPAEYESRALQLARDPGQLAQLRHRLAEGRSWMPLFDMARYTRDIEAAYRRMWEGWCAGAPPAPITIAGEA
ncbi:MAG TPA: tetratricopeptide repeat protein [Stellaceae bacterium]|nr:tetratricopeptide repeat protein [Stellaceae bacterium]